MSPSHMDVSHPACLAAREVLSLVGDKWSVLIVAWLGDGSRRFSELKRSVDGISQRMLTLTLRGLERDGLITRTAHATVPPRVDYELAPLGQTLLVPVRTLGAWADVHRFEMQQARARFDAARSAAQLKAAGPGKSA